LGFGNLITAAIFGGWGGFAGGFPGFPGSSGGPGGPGCPGGFLDGPGLGLLGGLGLGFPDPDPEGFGLYGGIEKVTDFVTFSFFVGSVEVEVILV
jgi:hypothetical protein